MSANKRKYENGNGNCNEDKDSKNEDEMSRDERSKDERSKDERNKDERSKDERNKITKANLPKKQKIQTTLSFGASNRITCKTCNMSYFPHIKDDKLLHTKFHTKAVNGRDWNDKWGTNVESFSVGGITGEIKTIDPDKRVECKVVEELLEMANTELSAPQDSQLWRDKDRGSVFICVINRKAVGILSVERITKGKWMVLDTGTVIDRDIELVLGISRIYVSKNWRRKGIGLKMLQCCLEHTIYGCKLDRMKVGFSQPSMFGTMLAKRFNSVRHKSNKLLIPVYMEE